MGEGVSEVELQAMGNALGEVHLQCVVIGNFIRKLNEDLAQIREALCRIQTQASRNRGRTVLVYRRRKFSLANSPRGPGRTCRRVPDQDRAG